MGSVLNKILGVLFPPFCVHCEKLLDYRDEGALCPDCLALWEKEKKWVCKDCFKNEEVCECVPHRASSKIKKSFHVAEYDPVKESVVRSIILTCKDHNYRSVYELAANELEKVLRLHIKSFKNTVITYVPRKKENIIKTGVDQSLLIAKELSRRLDIEFVPAINRVGGSEQKSLDFEERTENANASYEANENALLAINSRTVILYDDIMTTGASVSTCAEILKSMGARTVYVLCMGRVYRKGRGNGDNEE